MKIIAILALLLLFAGAAYSTAESEELETLLEESDDDGNLGNLQEGDVDTADESEDSADETEDTDSDDEGDNEVGWKKVGLSTRMLMHVFFVVITAINGNLVNCVLQHDNLEHDILYYFPLQCSCRNCYRFCGLRIKYISRKCFYKTIRRCIKYGKSKRCYYYCHPLLSHSACPRRLRKLPKKYCSKKHPIFCSNRYGVKG